MQKAGRAPVVAFMASCHRPGETGAGCRYPGIGKRPMAEIRTEDRTTPAGRFNAGPSTNTASDNRLSYGCINVPAALYDRHIKPMFTSPGCAVHVLAKVTPLDARVPFLRRTSGN